MKWEDASNYSRGERGKIAPNAWRLAGRFRLTVHGWHPMPGAWFVSAPDAGIDRAQLSAKDPDDAKAEAIRYVRSQLRGLLDAFDTATTETGSEDQEVKRG